MFLSPLFLFSDYKLSLARGLFFIIGTFAVFGISLGCEPKRKFSNIWVSLILLLALVRVFFDSSLTPAMEWFNFWLSCAGFMYVFCGVLLFYVVFCHADNIKNYLTPIVCVCILNSVLALSQMLNWDFMWTYTHCISGFMESGSQLGQYSALAIPIVACISPYLVVFPLFTLIVAKSVSPILAGAVGMAFLGGFKGVILKIKVGIGVLLLLAIWFNFGYITAKFQCRPIVWQKTLKTALQTPYIGGGYRSFHKKVIGIEKHGLISGAEYSRVHNDYLHTSQELGFPILICIGMFFVGLYKKFKFAVKDKLTLCLASSILIVLVNMSGQTLIRYASIAGTFIILLALLCVKLGEGYGD